MLEETTVVRVLYVYVYYMYMFGIRDVFQFFAESTVSGLTPAESTGGISFQEFVKGRSAALWVLTACAGCPATAHLLWPAAASRSLFTSFPCHPLVLPQQLSALCRTRLPPPPAVVRGAGAALQQAQNKA